MVKSILKNFMSFIRNTERMIDSSTDLLISFIFFLFFEQFTRTIDGIKILSV